MMNGVSPHAGYHGVPFAPGEDTKIEKSLSFLIVSILFITKMKVPKIKKKIYFIIKSFLYQKEKNQRAGVVEWYKNYLYGKGLIKKSDFLKTAIAAVEYDTSSAHKIINYFSDSLSMHSEILSDIGANWRSDIETEIQHCESLAYEIGKLAQNLYVASGGDNSPKNKTFTELPGKVKEQLYYRLDMPFRKWLISINPATMGEDKNKKIKEWQDEARKIAADYANELMDNTAECALIGHIIKGEKKNEIYSAPKARNIFNGNVKKIYEGK